MSDQKKHDSIFKDEVLLDHDYDGIQELDNPLAKWWVYLFYITIVFTLLYCGYYWGGYGKSMSEKHAEAVYALNPEKTPAPEAPGAFSMTGADTQNGQVLYVAKCAACHKPDGGGLVGPNLTDNFWVNGDGSDEAVYDVISNGVPAKGMIAWNTQLSPDEIKDLVAYLETLKGTNPANAKAAEGSEY